MSQQSDQGNHQPDQPREDGETGRLDQASPLTGSAPQSENKPRDRDQQTEGNKSPRDESNKIGTSKDNPARLNEGAENEENDK